jgi:two-component system NtrC family response regulator
MEDSILIIDDDESIRRTLSKYFGSLGFTVRTADSVADGVPLINKLQPKVVITDVRLPGLSGFDLVELATWLHLPKPMRVIVITAYDDGHGAERAEELGAWRFIPKPIDIMYLESVVREAMAA